MTATRKLCYAMGCQGRRAYILWGTTSGEKCCHELETSKRNECRLNDNETIRWQNLLSYTAQHPSIGKAVTESTKAVYLGELRKSTNKPVKIPRKHAFRHLTFAPPLRLASSWLNLRPNYLNPSAATHGIGFAADNLCWSAFEISARIDSLRSACNSDLFQFA